MVDEYWQRVLDEAKAKKMTKRERREQRLARNARLLKMAYPKSSFSQIVYPQTAYIPRKSKKERRAWWNNLTLEQQQAYIERKQEQKAKTRAETHYESPCPDFPEINDSNRAEWQARIKKLNPWVQIRQIA